MKKVLFAFCACLVANSIEALSLQLISHNQTSANSTISTLITDGSHIALGSASNATWDWDGTTLTSVGLYSAVLSVGSSPVGNPILADEIIDLSINTSSGTATAASYTCHDGTFLSSLVSVCGGYDFGVNAIDQSTAIWGPGLSASRTMGGDDGITGPQKTIAAYDFGFVSVAGTNFGDTIEIGNGVAVGIPGGELMTFQVIPIPATFWLFGSALGLFAFLRRSKT